MLTGMRRYRDAQSRKEDTRFIELEIAFYMGWTGHYTGDGAQPLHDTVHHDGWQGANPKGYTTAPQVHGLFETRFVDLMTLEGDRLHVAASRQRASLPIRSSPFSITSTKRAGTPNWSITLEKRRALEDGNDTPKLGRW